MSEADLLWYNSSTGETQVWYMRGDTVVNRGTVVDERGAVAPIGPPFSIVGAGDMDGDGSADIVWYNSQTGETQVWYMDGHRRVGRGPVIDENGQFTPIGPPFVIVGVGPIEWEWKGRHRLVQQPDRRDPGLVYGRPSTCWPGNSRR